MFWFNFFPISVCLLNEILLKLVLHDHDHEYVLHGNVLNKEHRHWNHGGYGYLQYSPFVKRSYNIK